MQEVISSFLLRRLILAMQARRNGNSFRTTRFEFHPQLKRKLLHKFMETKRLTLTLLHRRHVSPEQRDEETFIRVDSRWAVQYVFNHFLYLRCKRARHRQIFLPVFTDSTGVEVAFHLPEPGHDIFMRHAKGRQYRNTAVVRRASR